MLDMFEKQREIAARQYDGLVLGGQAVKFGPATEPVVRVSIDVRATHGFGDAAMAAILNGRRITRAGWNAAGQWVAAQWPDKGSKMAHPYLYLKNAQNELVPWVPSQGDLFATDWAILPVQPLP